MRTVDRRQACLGWVPWAVALSACMLLGAMLGAELVFVGASLIISLLYAALDPREKAGAPMLLVTLLAVQNLMIGIGAHLSGNMSEDLSYLTQVPFATTVVLFCSLVRERLELPMVDQLNRWFLPLVGWALLMCLVGGGSLPAKLVGLRNLTTFFMAFCVARGCLQRAEHRGVFYRQFGVLCALVALVGIVLMGQGVDFWMGMGLQEVYVAKQAPIGSLSEWGGRFTTSIDGVHSVNRMLSTYYEPVSLAYLFAAGLVCVGVAWRGGSGRSLTLLLVATGLVLTSGKGGWVVMGAYVAFLILRHFSRRKAEGFGDLTKPLLVVIACAAAVLTAYFLFVGGAVRPHFWAIINTWGSVLASPLGHGLGTGGNAAAAFGDLSGDWLSSGEESALMAFAYQVGIPGVVFLFMTMNAISTSNPCGVATLKGASLFSLPLILLAVSLLQDNTFAPQCIVPFMCLLGAFSDEEKADYGKVYPKEL